jgi:hypothetical protein
MTAPTIKRNAAKKPLISGRRPDMSMPSRALGRSGHGFHPPKAQLPGCRRSACPLAHDDEQGALSQAKKQRPRTKEYAYIQRCYYVSRPYLAAEPSRRRRYLIYMGSPKPISKGQGERHTVTVVA